MKTLIRANHVDVDLIPPSLPANGPSAILLTFDEEELLDERSLLNDLERRY